MSLLSFLCAVAFCSAIALIVMALRLNPRAALNRAMAILAFFYALWTLGVAVVTSAQSAFVVTFFNWIAVVGYLYGPVAYLAVSLIFTGVRRKPSILLFVPVLIVATLELVRALTGEWILSGFRPSPWGNVGVRATDNAWPLVDVAFHLFVAATAGVVYLRARGRSHSRRFRAIALYLFIGLVATVLISAFCVRVIWQLWGYPEPSVIVGMLGIIVDIYLIDRYRYLSLDNPGLEKEVMGAVEDAVIVFDSRFSIIKANLGAAMILDSKPRQLLGKDIASLFEDPDSVRREWQSAVMRGEKERKTPCSFQGTELVLTLSPVIDEFQDLVGGVATLRKAGPGPEPALDSFGITARERSVILMLMQGFTNKMIADFLFISPSTVKNHIANIYEKTGAGTRVELFRLLTSGQGPRRPAQHRADVPQGR